MARGRSSRGRSRGEVNEIINQMEHLSAMDGRRPDVVQLKRDCFQKLIRYMTAGIDMSAVFIPATKCVALSKFDIPLKKMLHLYLRSAARQNEAVALLVVQTLLTDAKDADPTIRGLAVRSLCSLRVPDLMENVFSAVDAGLRDAHPYVREVSVIGVLKCYHQDAPGTKLRNYIDIVRSLLTTDPGPQVVANCLYVLKDVGALDESIVTRPLVVSLLNHIRSFNEWAQCLVLDVLLTWYRPESESERFDMLEILDFGLNHTNSAVVLATAKLFLQYTASYPDQYAQVLTSVKGPLQTILLGREPEVAFTTLSNIIALAQRHPGKFSDLASDFFCRPEDPSYLKLLRLDALVAVADASNAYDAAEEASQYARDPEDEVARAAIRTVARIALKVAEVDGIFDRLLLFLGHQRSAVAGEAVAAMADVLRKYPDAAEACISSVAEVDATALIRVESKVAFVWMLGEFGERLQDAPYILEGLIEEAFSPSTTSSPSMYSHSLLSVELGTKEQGRDNEEEEEEQGIEQGGKPSRRAGKSPEVKLALLTATAKLFFKRPPECRHALGIALKAGAVDADSAVRDRSQLYYRLLLSSSASESSLEYGTQQGSGALDAAIAVIAAPRPAISRFEEAQPAEVRDKIFDEWNSLSVIYRSPAAAFIDAGDLSKGGRYDVDSIGGGDNDDDRRTNDSQDGGIGNKGGGGGAATALLLDLDNETESDITGSMPPELLGLSSAGREGDAPQSSPLDMFDSLMATGTSTATAPITTTTTATTTATFSHPSPSSQHISAAKTQDMNLDDFLGSFANIPPSIPTDDASLASPALSHSMQPDHCHHLAQPKTISLKPNPAPIQASLLQALWSKYDAAFSLSFTQDLGNGSDALSPIESRNFKDFVEFIRQANILSFAQPKEGMPPPYRFLFYAQEEGCAVDEYILCQMIVSKVPKAEAVVIVKSSEKESGEHVKELLQTLMLTF